MATQEEAGRLFNLGSFDLVRFIYVAVALLVGLTIHEASHAFIADRLGDPTARSLGRVTFNPIAHMDPTGTLLLIFSSIVGYGIGWGKPVPVNPSNLRPDPKTGYALVAAAGPVSNLLLAALLAFVLQYGLGLPVILENLRLYTILSNVLFYTIVVSVTLAIFNLIPLPPLDGFSVLLGILPNTAARSLSRLYQWGPGLLLLLVFLGGGLLSQYLEFFRAPILRVLGVA